MLKLDPEEERLLKAIGSFSRLKILVSLWRAEKKLIVHRICRSTGLNRATVRYNLSKLMECGLVSRKLYGSMSLYTFNTKNPKARALIEFLQKVLS
jgi:predicted transcriptional regulator